MSNIYIQEPPATGKVLMKTSVGDLDLELWTKEAPKACKNFIQLCMEGYYDNTIFHRVVKGFIVQGGDPTGTGEGGESIYGEPFKDEFHSRLRFVRRGLLAMANAGKDDNGSQFFFTLAATPELQNKHTIFGKITGETIYNMLKLEDTLVDETDRPIYPQKILKTEVLSNPFDDIEPRVVPKTKSNEERIKKRQKKGVKDFKLLSFGEEAEEDEDESVVLNKKLSTKGKSAHDVLNDPKLSSQPVIEVPPKKKSRIDGSGHSESDSDASDDKLGMEEKTVAEKEKQEMAERIKSKLKGSKKFVNETKVQKHKDNDDESEEEEYYLGKEKHDERKRKTIEIKKEIRDLKRGMRDDKNKKLEEEKQKVEEEKKKEVKSELIKEYHQTQEKYKEEHKKIPKKGATREDFTLSLLNKFKNKIISVKEHQMDGEVTVPKKSEKADDEEDDPDDMSWIVQPLRCEEKAPVLAKDASSKGDDWFEIYDPRNPINKRRRGDGADKSKSSKK
ncbi:peptidyl-prolyl cis-trans isomerase CWC27 homolog [Copidosoma floridanum]|uniref:peptidyl-prolyl cis-trans isomerase CWC27 homolog n=1 Tax=Copidosoma floridanum TaxID=29053 RepID=UPI0006C9701D|nr:peptidyl-prolyl cis-trans isomerase CWC27 homolog [Copidosoma floridanum]